LCLAGIAGVGLAGSWLRGLFSPNAITTPQASQTTETLIEPTFTTEPSPTLQSTATDAPLPTHTMTPTLISTPTETTTPTPSATQATEGLKKGGELRATDSLVTLRLRDVKYDQGTTRIGNPSWVPITFVFEFTNHSGEPIPLDLDQTKFRVEDNLGNEGTCLFWQVTEARPAIRIPVDPGRTVEIGVLCGEGKLPSEVTTYTLCVTGLFSSLPDSTWEHQIVR
jgi:hypothetical protein